MAPFRIRHDAIPFDSCAAGSTRIDLPTVSAQMTKTRRTVGLPQSQEIDFSGLDPAAQPGQRLPARIGWTLIAGAGLSVAIGSAARAKSLAVGLAQRPDRQGQKHLLAQHIFKQQTVFLIITDFGLRRCYGALGSAGVGADGAEDEVEVGGQRDFDRLDAAGAGNLKSARESAPAGGCRGRSLWGRGARESPRRGRRWPDRPSARLLRRNRLRRA